MDNNEAQATETETNEQATSACYYGAYYAPNLISAHFISPLWFWCLS